MYLDACNKWTATRSYPGEGDGVHPHQICIKLASQSMWLKVELPLEVWTWTGWMCWHIWNSAKTNTRCHTWKDKPCAMTQAGSARLRTHPGGLVGSKLNICRSTAQGKGILTSTQHFLSHIQAIAAYLGLLQ